MSNNIQLDNGALQNSSYLTAFKIKGDLDAMAQAAANKYGVSVTPAERQILGALLYSIDVDLADLPNKQDWVLSILDGSPEIMTAFSVANPRQLAQAMLDTFQIDISGTGQPASVDAVETKLVEKAHMITQATGDDYLLVLAEEPIASNQDVKQPVKTDSGQGTTSPLVTTSKAKKGLSTGAMWAIGLLLAGAGAGGVWYWEKRKAEREEEDFDYNF